MTTEIGTDNVKNVGPIPDPINRTDGGSVSHVFERLDETPPDATGARVRDRACEVDARSRPSLGVSWVTCTATGRCRPPDQERPLSDL
jgi:hypothetical protein